MDEYRLVVQPVALGDGLPLFAGLAAPFVLERPGCMPAVRCSISITRLPVKRFGL